MGTGSGNNKRVNKRTTKHMTDFLRQGNNPSSSGSGPVLILGNENVIENILSTKLQKYIFL